MEVEVSVSVEPRMLHGPALPVDDVRVNAMGSSLAISV